MSFREELNRQYAALGVSEQVIALGEEAERKCCGRFADIDRISELNQMKVLQAFRDNRVSEAHLMPSTGYGYNDIGYLPCDVHFVKRHKDCNSFLRSKSSYFAEKVNLISDIQIGCGFI